MEIKVGGGLWPWKTGQEGGLVVTEIQAGVGGGGLKTSPSIGGGGDGFLWNAGCLLPNWQLKLFITSYQ